MISIHYILYFMEGWGFKSPDHAQLPPPLCLRLVDQYVSYQLLLQCQAFLLAVMLPSRMAMDSPSEIVNPNKLFYLTVALITATKIN